MKLYFIVFFLFFFSCEKIGEGYEWNKKYGFGFYRKFGTIGYDYGWNIAYSSFDEGSIIVGSQQPQISGDKNLWAIKTDKNGMLIWEKTFGGLNNDEGFDVIATSDGGFLFTGYTWSFGNSQQIYVIKTDLNGQILWENNYGGSVWDVGNSVIELKSGGYAIVGFTNSPGLSSGNTDIALLKIDNYGNEIWFKAYGNNSYPNHEWGNDIIELYDNSFLIVGARDRYDKGSKNSFLMRIDKDGNIIWEKELIDDNNIDEISYSIAMTSNGHIYVSNSINSADNFEVYMPKIIKIDPAGNIIWSRKLNSNSREYHRFQISPCHNGEIILSGTTIDLNSYLSKSDAFMTRMNNKGDIIWSRSYGTSDEDDWGWSLYENPRNELIMVGSTKSFGASLFDVFLVGADILGISNQ